MGMLQQLESEPGYLKAGFQGFAGSGKTWTAITLAIGTRRMLGLDGPIAFFDTEGGAQYIRSRIKDGTGKEPIGMRSRSFDDLMGVGKECEASGVSVLVVDSVTHIWRDLCDSYLSAVNVVRKAKNQSVRNNLEFQDWNPIKSKWAKWTDFFLNSKLHVVICGRAGYEYDKELNEETGKKELVKTGIKMKTEGEFGFEPSLGVEMERVQNVRSDVNAPRILRRATIIKDRFGLIDGMECDNPTFDFFKPHVERLVVGGHAPIDTTLKTDVGVDPDGDNAFARERRERTILAEEIQGEFSRAWPGQTAPEKKGRMDAMEAAFGIRSWTAIENMPARRLRDGLAKIREIVATVSPAPVATATEKE